jgi:hypothetical protein
MKRFSYENLQTIVFIIISVFVLGGLIFSRQIGEYFTNEKPLSVVETKKSSKREVKSATSIPLTNTAPSDSTAAGPAPNTGSQLGSSSPSAPTQGNWVERCGPETEVAPPVKYIDVSWLYVGETEIHEGTPGRQKTCEYPDGSIATHIFPDPLPKRVYVGSREPKVQTNPSYNGLSYDQARVNCQKAANTSAFKPCVEAYGFPCPSPNPSYNEYIYVHCE